LLQQLRIPGPSSPGRPGQSLLFPSGGSEMNRYRTSGSARNRFRPQFEALENRWVPATMTFNAATATLTVTGTASKDAIVITDDGTNNAGAVTVSANGTTLFTSGPTAGVNQVHSIQIDTQGGNHDSVRYTLTGNMVANNRSVTVTFGSGKGDTFEANINGNLVN